MNQPGNMQQQQKKSSSRISLYADSEASSTYRGYRSMWPSTNKLLIKKWDAADIQHRQRRLNSIRSKVDCGPPIALQHPQSKLKKIMAEEQRRQIIDRDNKILLERIMKSKTNVDNDLGSNIPTRLSMTNRQKELVKIAGDNKNIITKITATRSYYDRTKMRGNWESMLKYRSIVDKNQRSTPNW
ncbi:hypothetical protein CAPTEDRAFT_220859 [Capitella teleta]|uniref:Cilia- and flagella-associated protein 97 n=1 Tax=Capitella teleta TaxID=283909 RepID=R7V0Q3_CAPTE|nr:hypothetical protein CAPTEDRAFT_220859 [Capitella teleta]|eukprot:ELU09792.1 hypothetical protein CAPTEDRAFT_220859 [Capitella teleta]